MNLNKLPRVLVTTQLQDSWKVDEPTLFLGEWCKAFNNKSTWLKMDSQTVNYHWTDREKLERDYNYLLNFYERLLLVMSVSLNHHHQVEFSNKYWRVLIGPWLSYFLHSVFDKWESVQKAKKEHEIEETIKIDLSELNLIPSSMAHFFSSFIMNDYWNHHIYTEIIKYSTNIKQNTITSITTKKYNQQNQFEYRQTTKSLRNQARNLYNKFLSKIAAYDKYFIIGSYMSIDNEIKLQIILNQIPKLWSSEVPKWTKTTPDRRDFFIKWEFENEFEEFLSHILPFQIPKIYLENYIELLITTQKTGWPLQPKVIFTSNALWHDDVTMAYVAEKIENGSKLVYGQHGGFGIQAYSWAEHHERQIADRYFTWGWSVKSKSNLIPVGMLKSVNKYLKKRLRPIYLEKLVLVRVSSSPYIFRIDSDIGLPQSLININRSLSFAENLPKIIRENNLLVRLYPMTRAYSMDGHSDVENAEKFYSEKTRWNELFPQVEINDGSDSIEIHINRARLVVYSYNGGTGYLEFIAANIPVIMFWDMVNSPVRAEAIPFFEQLRSVGLFHDSPLSAAKHVTAIWEDVDSWWNSEEVKKVLKIFSDQFCKLNTKLVSDIAHELKTLVKN
jgi:putative transferase (TIGR04331 family)